MLHGYFLVIMWIHSIMMRKHLLVWSYRCGTLFCIDTPLYYFCFLAALLKYKAHTEVLIFISIS